MKSQMDIGYFDEKKTLATSTLLDAAAAIIQMANRINEMDYSMPHVVRDEEFHEEIKGVVLCLNSARRSFEVARWAATKTDLEFGPWLEKHGLTELQRGWDKPEAYFDEVEAGQVPEGGNAAAAREI